MARGSGLSNWVVVEVKRIKGGTDLEYIKLMIPLRQWLMAGTASHMARDVDV